jgi:PAS domain S-box-containing protein
MSKKPTYEELEQRVKESEKEVYKLKQVGEVLRESEERYRSLIHKIQAAVVVHDADTRIIACNSKAQDLLGLTEVQMLGKTAIDPDWKFLNADGERMSLKEYPVNQVLDTRQPLRDLITGLYLPNKIEQVWVLVNADPVFDYKGNIQQVIVTFMDITEHKKMEETLRESEERFRYLTESSPLGVFQTDKDGSVLYLNNKWLAITGMSLQEALGFGWTQALHPEDRPQILAEWARCLEEKRGYDGEFRFVRPFGDIRWVHTRTSPVFSPAGDIISHVGVNEDITDRKQAEEALKESEEKYRQLFEMESDAIFLVRKGDGQILEVNTAGLKLYGFKREELLKMKNTDLSAEPDVTQKATMEQKRKIPIRYHRKNDGTVFPVEITASHLTWQGQEVHIAAIRDITIRIEAEKEKVKYEEQLRQSHKMEAIGTLAGGIAHDFNNMLGIILGNTELAMDDVPEWNPARLNLEEVKTASLRAKDVVRQLLSFARKTEQERKPVKINPIVTGALKLLRSSIPTSIEIRSNSPKESQIVIADPTQINQIMINLCTNASHAMEEDGGVLEISLDSITLDESTAQSFELSPGRYVKLTVNDNGHGIDPEIKDRIFDPYFTTREVGKGSGMGLAVVHGIVMNHNGAITVDSDVGKGTIFNVFLPIVRREPVPEITIDEDLPTGKERILFVDDEESIVNMGSQRLERLGYKVESTTSPLEALDLFRSKPDRFDLVITDLTMPKMTGDKLVKEILNIRPEMPITICTGFSEKMDGEKAREIGAAGYLEKPHDKRSLAKMVRKVLDGKKE